jgi:hypothetical protein
MTGGTISGNVTNGDGGGVYIDGLNANFVLNAGAINENTAGGKGGGVCTKNGGSFTMLSGGSITGNTARSSGSDASPTSDHGGGGLFADGAFIMSGGTITGNRAPNSPYGGVNLYGSAHRLPANAVSLITGNTNDGSSLYPNLYNNNVTVTVGDENWDLLGPPFDQGGW